MTFTCNFSSKLTRLSLLAGALLLGFLLLWVIQAHFVIRVAFDPRLNLKRELLHAALSSLPNSTRLNLELGKAELAGAPDYQSAVSHASRAVELTPQDYQGWYLLGLAQDALGRQAEAEQALAQAVKLAPANSKVTWLAANVLLRGGRSEEALTPLRAAIAGDESLSASALDLVWQASGRSVEAVQQLAVGRTSAQWALASFFVEQSLVAEAVKVFQSLDPEQRLTGLRGPAFITQLIQAKQFAAARALWLGLVVPEQSAAPRELLWNGGFEWDAPPHLEHFNWLLGRSDYARISLDRRQAHEGARSLRIVFAGRDTTILSGEVQQLLALRPGAGYQLECYAKAENLVTPEGPRVALFHGGTQLAASEPVSDNTAEWQKLSVSFTAPADSEALSVRVVRRPKFSYDEPTKGAVWFDDFSMNCTSGCQ